MFTIYHSNQLDLLKSLTAELIKREPLDSVFTKDVILVQSKGMAQWLQMQLAEEQGIAANIDFLLPANFVWQMYSAVVPDVPEKNSFDKESMSWKLMHLLPTVIDLPDFSLLKHYVSQDNQARKYYQLSTRIADLFDQYLVYRPEWIAAWEKGELVAGLDEAQQWQSQLWQQLVAYTQQLGQSIYHRANIYQQFIERLATPNLDSAIQAVLPKRIFIFGIAALPPVYLQSLNALGQHIDIHLMFTNPCRWYWGDIPDQRWLNHLLQTQWQHYKKRTSRNLLKNGAAQFDFFMPVSQSNPLLASWGKLGRDNLFLLQEFNHKRDIEGFVDLGKDCLLHAVQQDILDLEDKSIVGHDEDSFLQSNAKQSIDKDDFSISLHACHSEQREVEVLYDYLLSILDKDPTLEPRDLVVMVADIDRYVPYIESVFGNAPSSRYLPFTISDQKVRYIDPIVQAFFTLLELPQSRFTTEDLFNLLEVPALAMQFAIDEKQLKQLRKWVIDSGIRWGLNDEMVQSFDLPSTSRHTWRFGLTRMLLGYVMNSENGSWQSILPYDGSSGLSAELIGKLANFLLALTQWYQTLSLERSLEEWRPLCYELLQTFFVANQTSEPLLMVIDQQWQALIDSGLQAGYQQPISIIVLHDALQMSLEQSHVEQRFLAGKINFCTMMPMRSIPFKVVCLLGMNDGVYPRTAVPLGFDLLSQQSQRGDRSRRDDDRYLFLEAMLSAQQQLYISYIGRAMADNSERYPSVLVDELLDYIKQSYVLKGDESLNIDESALRLSEHLTVQHTRMPFNADNYINNKHQSGYYVQSYADEWLPAAQYLGEHKQFVDALPHQPVSLVTVDELQKFYRHPIKMLLQQRLNIYFSHQGENLPSSELFDLDGLERYQLNQLLLDYLIKDRYEVQSVFTRIKDEGLLPYGAFGDIILEQQYQEMQVLAEKIMLEKQTLFTQEVDLHFDNITLQGWLTDIQDNGILRWRPGNLSIYDGMALWIEHLIYCVVYPQQQISQSRAYGRNDTVWRFLMIEPKVANLLLTDLVQGYEQGLNCPLLLPLKSAWSWLETAFDQESQSITHDATVITKAREKLMVSWQGGFNLQGESDDYYQRVVPELTEDNIQQIEQLAGRYLLPILKYRSE